jgi:hypothetical protein
MTKSKEKNIKISPKKRKNAKEVPVTEPKTTQTTENEQKKPKEEKTYQLIGSFNFVQKTETKRKGDHYGENFFKINVADKIENRPREIHEIIKNIYAFPDVVKREQVWKDLEENNWIDKRYLLFCYWHRYKKLYRLFDWQEIDPKPTNN